MIKLRVVERDGIAIVCWDVGEPEDANKYTAANTAIARELPVALATAIVTAWNTWVDENP